MPSDREMRLSECKLYYEKLRLSLGQSTLQAGRKESYLWALPSEASNLKSILYLPTMPIGEHNVTLFITSLSESHTCVLFPVSHGLLEHGSLAAWKNS